MTTSASSSICGSPTDWVSRLHARESAGVWSSAISWVNASTISLGDVSSTAPSAGVISWSELVASCAPAVDGSSAPTSAATHATR